MCGVCVCVFVGHPGADFGLKLEINIERYEYVDIMQQTDAGIKVSPWLG